MDFIREIQQVSIATHNVPRICGDCQVHVVKIIRFVWMLNDGLRRAGQIKNGTAAWPKLKGSINRA
jgi:hypothetical protein